MKKTEQQPANPGWLQRLGRCQCGNRRVTVENWVRKLVCDPPPTVENYATKEDMERRANEIRPAATAKLSHGTENL